MLSLMRLRQWSKSILVFVPFLLTLEQADGLLNSFLIFISFGLASSAGYSINDVLDRDSDKLHPHKKYRPVASGTVSVKRAVGFSFFLLVISLTVAFAVNPLALFVIVSYLVLNIAYSVYLKKLAVIDVLVLSLFYILRIFAGAAAIMVEVSNWLLTFAFVAFLSLGFAKRFIELETMKAQNGDDSSLQQKVRGYEFDDSNWSFVSGISLGITSSLVLALYLDLGRTSGDLIEYLIVPLWTYWILRIWLLASRKELHHDPTAFAIKDKVTWLIGGVIFALLIFGGDLFDFVLNLGGLS